MNIPNVLGGVFANIDSWKCRLTNKPRIVSSHKAVDTRVVIHAGHDASRVARVSWGIGAAESKHRNRRFGLGMKMTVNSCQEECQEITS